MSFHLQGKNSSVVAPAFSSESFPPAGAVLQTLKDQTREVHLNLENTLDLLALRDAQRYQQLLCAFHAVHQVLEPLVYGRSEWATLPDLQPLPKLPWLDADLAFFEVTASPERPTDFQLADWQAVLGAVYVMEGSTLGGQVIGRHLATLGITPQTGGRFFSGYQQDTGVHWKQTRHLIESQTTDPQKVLQGALDTFQLFQQQIQKAQP
ncbi:biliverdin-producing heme oxygenase [Deinococcus roseus]|uniref:Heme oxygenase n=1 Tax=Deinococcus roseus TaxID=392414 RepID=A0ABQ2CW88_9DEIO|nr:biliverdin-producing heme oxygenase [Deinococcus roseus]GGJ26744.1 heme oxygenase [Deinococcus roseus]